MLTPADLLASQYLHFCTSNKKHKSTNTNACGPARQPPNFHDAAAREAARKAEEAKDLEILSTPLTQVLSLLAALVQKFKSTDAYKYPPAARCTVRRYSVFRRYLME